MQCYEIAVVAVKIFLVELMEDVVLSTDGVGVFWGGVSDIYFIFANKGAKEYAVIFAPLLWLLRNVVVTTTIFCQTWNW